MQLDAKQIRQLRTDQGWTQQQLADICGLSLRTIQRVELNGLASLETTKSLAAAFTKDRRELMETEDTPPNLPQAVTVPVWVLAITFLAGLLCGVFLLRVFTATF
ncbi:helix-turn-helix transcriptional regulator [Alkalimonas collagenimarina]|uniref:Helix-turn-helix transcriptional regulator n=1 Tax=Alkalimonas collagenimarina TaxID=400390 RepID=A0ABT9H150_9GAMM|nr:helix-turn-helix transcriptional regulator [Alkalimonas collagenimarina]MDP4537050.1 helix-turn-helix transcriptional regulator [Alkalimonas collagenimarina]